jgi:lactate dehydrogenase-like 2-hydroxyacid dehydrogenase
MPTDAADIVLFGPTKPTIVNGLKAHRLTQATTLQEVADLSSDIAAKVRGVGVAGLVKMDRALVARFPKLEIVSTFGVGYDHIDTSCARERGIVVTNTPDVLTEETADTVLALLLCTARDFINGERYVREGEWAKKPFPLSKATLRDRTVGIVGMGRIGQAIARRLEAMKVPVVYHSRRKNAEVTNKYYANLMEMARDVDTLVVITPGGAETQNLINADVLKALGSNGILINAARGSVVDEDALIAALKNGTIMAAGLDVFAKEPNVPQDLIALKNVVLFPHLGSASVYTRNAMDQLVADNLNAWFAGKAPLTPVVETPLSISKFRS